MGTARLVLRRFEEGDINAIYAIFSDERVNRFLPWFPLKSIEEAEAFFEERYRANYKKPTGYNYAVCLRTNNVPVGYVNLNVGEGYDLGYGLKSEFWHQGIMTEACLAVLKRAEEDKIPYVTATHDVNNPASGNVMRRLGMWYVYTYESNGSRRISRSRSECIRKTFPHARAGRSENTGTGRRYIMWNWAYRRSIFSLRKIAAHSNLSVPHFCLAACKNPLCTRGPFCV